MAMQVACAILFTGPLSDLRGAPAQCVAMGSPNPDWASEFLFGSVKAALALQHHVIAEVASLEVIFRVGSMMCVTISRKWPDERGH